VISFALQEEDNYEAVSVTSQGREIPTTIGICAGEKGKLSRVLNNVLTPVTHPLLPRAAAPGQMSIEEISQIRSAMSIGVPGLTLRRTFYCCCCCCS